ncbi:site-specific integrase [Mesonia mobilis]|uniref:Transposase n=1 Tax=Mesonia mobilis TaxID=369791 RepID=A0ABQ3BT63_9FLAO|nr:site-specific integrase [Mesonia mobilis]MBQ0738544.1 site-specific integrase [Aquimarina celericrescens]GGZ56369.1 transposase [Mesonia mobilis]
MNNYKISILFFLQKSRINKQDKCPIRCRITYNKKRQEFATGIFVEIKNWNINKKKTTNESLNDKLIVIESGINSAFLKLKLSGEHFDVSDVLKTFRGEKSNKDMMLLEFFSLMLEKKKKLIGIELTEKTWDKFLYVQNHLKDFITCKFQKNDLYLQKLKFNFIEDFEYFLKTEKKHKQITANKAIQRFKYVIKQAVGQGYLERNPFYDHKPKKTRKEVVFLSKQELDLLESKPIQQSKLDRTRDCFIFCCYTGLAYREMYNLEKKNLVTGFDGNIWIQMQREKTKKNISVPVLPKAIRIIEKYKSVNSEYILPRLSNQRFNSYLKEIAGIVGIDKRLTHHMARKTFATTVLLYNNVPMEIVSELLGHSSIKVTQAHYGKILKKKVSEEMKKLYDRF